MAIKSYKPTSPGRRFATTPAFDEITKSEPEKSLDRPVKRKGGRNNNGRITTRHQGGGHKRLYRIIDFKRDKDGVPGRVDSIEYDPNRNCRIALIVYARRREALHPGARTSWAWAPRSRRARRPTSGSGCALPLRNIPVGTVVHNIETAQGPRRPDRPFGRHAPRRSWPRKATTPSCACPRGEMRMIHLECRATVGEIGNAEHENLTTGKAGRKRWMGVRPGRSRHDHEPGRPPARWWRGLHASGP